MITIKYDPKQIERLAKACETAGKKLPVSMSRAVNKTLNKTKTQMSKDIRKEVAAPAKAIKGTMKIVKRATPRRLAGTTRLTKTGRFSLANYGARQNGRGVSYRISKTGGRKTVTGGFQGPRPGVMKASWKGRVFKRVGKSRLPIVQVFGPSPWGVHTVNRMTGKTLEFAEKDLTEQIEKQITDAAKAINNA